MENNSSKLKRKELEDVNYDFSDFSLSSPATKIRRLDSELSPIIEDEECDQIPLLFDQSVPPRFDTIQSGGGLTIEELPPDNEERAIVLFQPTSNPHYSPSQFSFSVNHHLIPGLRNQVLWSTRSNSSLKPRNNEVLDEDDSDGSQGCLAVVPWVPSQLPSASATEISSDNFEMMDVQDVDEGTSMDVEDGPVIEEQQRDNVNGVGGMSGVQQWQHQHCMIPQHPHNSPTPLVWYR